jgi:hypothetical protein
MSARRLLLAIGAGLLAAAPAHAVVYRLDFTGTITSSFDQGSIVFGNGTYGGQVGLAIAGSILFDPAAYADQLPADPTIGAYGPTGPAFPQPLDVFTSSYTISGQTFLPSMNMGMPSGHSTEAAALYDKVPASASQQDIIDIRDSSQALFCADPNVASTCTGGAQGTDEIALKLYGIADIVAGDQLAQVLNFSSADIAAIVGGPGGGQTSGYVHQRANDANTAWLYNISGTFDLTSLSLAPVSDGGPVTTPEPASLGVLGLGLAALCWLRRGPAQRRGMRLARH